MKSKKCYKTLKDGMVWENGTLYCVYGLKKRMSIKRTCRFHKHKKNLTCCNDDH